MSRIFEALNRAETQHRTPNGNHSSTAQPEMSAADVTAMNAEPPETMKRLKVLNEVSSMPVETVETRSVSVKASPGSRLIALTDPDGLGAEKFRALVTRLDDMAQQRELKSFQVTSSVIHEGKTLVAANVAVTFAKYCGSKTLLMEGDFHRPTLAAFLGLEGLRGISHWWSSKDSELAHFVHKVKDMPLWFLPAGEICDRPSDILRSTRFAKAYTQLTSQFEWIVVDSTPMLPIVDVNLWSKLVDGTLLVVRQGLTPIKALKNGLQALDHPKLIGAVINDAIGSDEGDYFGESYGLRKLLAMRHSRKS
jgi:protein-tyrosine kinase